MKKTILTLISALLLSACSQTQGTEDVPEDMWNWRIGLSMPSFYPIKVSSAYGVSIQEGWHSPMLGQSRVMSRSTLEKIRRDVPKYDGFGLPLASGILTQLVQMRHTNHLPDKIVIAWTSLYNSKFYITEFDVTPEIKKRMYTKQNESYNARLSCYQSDFDFGFMPNGQVKVWIGGCGRYTYITELAPSATPETDSMGSNAAIYDKSSKKRRIIQRAKDANVITVPLPLDKIHQVFPAKDAVMDTLADKIPASALWVEKEK